MAYKHYSSAAVSAFARGNSTARAIASDLKSWQHDPPVSITELVHARRILSHVHGMIAVAGHVHGVAVAGHVHGAIGHAVAGVVHGARGLLRGGEEGGRVMEV